MTQAESHVPVPPPGPSRPTILSRLAGHLRRQDWTAVGLEFVVVVLGVFIGLQATNWNADLADRRREAGTLKDIAADLRQDREEFASGRANALRRIAAANYLIERATGQRVTRLLGPRIDNSTLSARNGITVPATPTPDAEDRGPLWSAVVTGYYPTASTTAFDALSSAGRLDLLRDPGLVREIQTYKLVTDGLQATQTSGLRPQIIGVREVGEAHGLSAFASVDEDALVRELIASPQLRATVESQLGWSVIHVLQIDSADRRAAALQKRLENDRTRGSKTGGPTR